MEELKEATGGHNEGQPKRVVSCSSKFKTLTAAIKDGSESGVLLTEFAELTAAAWRHVAGEGSCEAVLQRSASTCNAVRACRQRTAQIG